MAKTPSTDPKHYLQVAEEHLERVRAAAPEPDWVDLSTYGFYCLEALVRALTLKENLPVTTKHWEKAERARQFATQYGLPDVSELLSTLSDARKAFAYGDDDFDESAHDADEIAEGIQAYYDAVSAHIGE